MTKVIKLIELILTNFKGIQSFTLNAQGSNIDVYGDNGTGKTSLFDAFSWVLFGKDSQGSGQPEKWIKTLDADGQVIHKLEHSVEAILDIDGKQVSLKKVFKEKWTKPRGTTKPVFDGHTTFYYFNGSEVKQKDYQKEIASIIDEELFKLLTNPAHFNERFDQKQRRALLFEIFGDSITDDDVIKLKPNLSIVKQILSNKSAETAQEDIKKELNRIDKELKQADSDIRAQENAIFGGGTKSLEFIEQGLANTRALIEDKQAELARIQNGGEVAVKQQKKLELKNEQLQIINELQVNTSGDAAKLQDKLNRIDARKNEVLRDIQKYKLQILDCEDTIKTLDSKLVKLRSERDQLKLSKFEASHIADQCPTCKQSLPAEQVENAHKQAEEQFNLNKSKQLEQVIASGKATKADYDEAVAMLEELKKLLAENEAGVEKLQAEFKKVNKELSSMTTQSVDLTHNERYKVLQRHIDNIDAEIAELQTGTTTQIDTIKQDIRQLQSDVATLEQERANKQVAERAKQQIEDIKINQKSLAKQYDELSAQQAMIVEFSRTKAELLEQRINEKFPTVRFKLFEKQVNGDLKDTCETLYGEHLVPYNGGLNRAAQINAGLEIINVLSEHYKVVAPIMIDNAEAVTKVAETAGQQIKLSVSERDKWLWYTGSSNERAPEINHELVEIDGDENAQPVNHELDTERTSDDEPEQYEQDDLF